MLLWMTWLGCQEPFDLDRHDLAGFRIAAMQVDASGSGTGVPALAIVQDGRLWADELATLAWYAVDDVDAVWDLDLRAAPDAAGPAPELPLDGVAWWGVVATAPSGAIHRSAVQVPDPRSSGNALPLPELQRLDLEVGTVEAEDLTLAARAELDPEPAAFVPPGGFARLSIDGIDGRTRWMATGRGRFFELEDRVTDWAAGDLRLDDDAIEGSRAPLEPGTISVVALQVGLDTGPRWRARDVHVGQPGDGVWVGGRWLPTDPGVSASPGDVLHGTLEAADSASFGLRLVNAEVRDTPDDWGTDAIPCHPEGPFDPSVLIRQRCTRADLVGAEVALQVGSPP